jgi:hypothetical protein
MKKVNLVKITMPDKANVRTDAKAYSVYLGPGKVARFKSYRAARKFSLDYTNQITHLMHELNFAIVEAFTMYRQAWFYFHDQKTGVNYLALEKMISDNIATAESMLQKLVINTNGVYGADLISRFCGEAMAHLIKAFKCLETIYSKRSDYAAVRRAEICKERISLSYEMLQQWIKQNL